MYERPSTYRPHRNFGEGGKKKSDGYVKGVKKELKGLGKAAGKEAKSWFGL